jgi:hypothetical protein
MDYYWYDILIIYNAQKTSIMNTLDEFKLKFSMQQQTQNRINYLDIAIKKYQNKLRFGINRKPTTTDHLLHNTSCHLHKHKKIGYQLPI